YTTLFRSRRLGGRRRRGAGGRSGGFGAGAFLGAGALGGLAFLGEFDGALAGGALFGGEAVLRRAGGARGGRRRGPRLKQALFGRRGRSEVAAARLVRAGALGLDDHGLGTAVAEALLHRAGADRSGPAGLQGQGLAPAGGGSAAVVVLVAHALALLVSRRSGQRTEISTRASGADAPTSRFADFTM